MLANALTTDIPTQKTHTSQLYNDSDYLTYHPDPRHFNNIGTLNGGQVAVGNSSYDLFLNGKPGRTFVSVGSYWKSLGHTNDGYGGNWYIGTSFSDDRLKISEEELPINTSNILMNLRPLKYKKYDYIDRRDIFDKDESGNIIENEIEHFMNDISQNLTHDEFGLMAQEIYTIPELRHLVKVPEDSDMEKIKDTEIYDGSLNEPEGFYEEQGWGVKEPAGVNYIGFVPLLIKGFQEQQAVITQQKVIINQDKELITQQQTIINNLLQQLSNSNTYDDFKNNIK